jgi:autoinducer 2 (AI-2) kinase
MIDTTKNYLIIDIGTGNVRVAITNSKGQVLGIERENVNYNKDEKYQEALEFDPNELWRQIIRLSKKVLLKFPHASISAITVSSQREGIVLIDRQNNSIVGLPNHDHRGRNWEGEIKEKDYISRKCGRYPSSIFSALKLVGLRKRHPEIFDRMTTFLSISDWAQFMLSGVKGYEHSQASETLLYDVEAKDWSQKLCKLFLIDIAILPPLHASGVSLGPILPEMAKVLGLSSQTQVIVGGSDTQLAIKSTSPTLDDVIIVAGTTTPIVKLITKYIIDPRQKTWTNRHIEEENFILETNAGVTGLNYQRLKEIFYPREGYEIMEKELQLKINTTCTASLGSLIADEEQPITLGGFLMETPLSQDLSRADFVRSAIQDIASCIKKNYEYLCSVSPHDKDYIWGCGGGFQSGTLTQLLADLLGKEIRIRDGFQHASIIGGILVCNEFLGIPKTILEIKVKSTTPNTVNDILHKHQKWQKIRNQVKENFNN